MDVATLLALAAALAAVAALAIVIRRRPGDGGTVALSAQIQSAQQGMQGNVQLLAASLDELRGEVHRSLGATEQQLTTQTGATQRTLSDLSRQLGALSEQGQRIGELAKDIGSLQDLLRAPKARGGFGELLLERLLGDALPVSAYEVQYTFRDGSRVDAIVRYAGRIVPIDAKFPNESWTALAQSPETERRTKRRAFLHQVRRHVEAVSRYVHTHPCAWDAQVLLASMALGRQSFELTVKLLAWLGLTGAVGTTACSTTCRLLAWMALVMPVSLTRLRTSA